jgi:hypothetical protein
VACTINNCKWPLYYKSGITLAFAIARVVNYATTVMLQIVDHSLMTRVVIYDQYMFIVQATDAFVQISDGGGSFVCLL